MRSPLPSPVPAGEDGPLEFRPRRHGEESDEHRHGRLVQYVYERLCPERSHVLDPDPATTKCVSIRMLLLPQYVS